MDPEEHKVIEEHPFNYRYPRGEVIKRKIQLTHMCRADVSKLQLPFCTSCAESYFGGG